MMAVRLFFWTVLLPFTLFPDIANCHENENPQHSAQAVMGSKQFESSATCKDHHYEVHHISEDPLVIYIDSFISQEEALQLVSLRHVRDESLK
jgi:hypothetical protein